MASSSNPFRKPATQHAESRFPAIDSIGSVQLFPPKTSFRDENVPPAAAQSPSQKAKVVKKVRVLSPPPRSPDSPELTASYFNSAAPPQSYAQEQDPFSNAVVDENSWQDASATPPLQPQPALPQGRQPLMETTQMQRPVQTVANPFSKKKTQDAGNPKDLKEDLHEEGEALRTAQSARRSLNVDSFKRLLMTGDASPLSSTSPTDSASDLDRSKPAQDAAPAAARTNKEKKAPPPPPSSRHGKVIKPEQNVTSSESTISSPVEKLAEPVAHHKEPSRPVLSRESSASSNSSIEEPPVKFDSHPAELTSSPDQMDASTTPPLNAKKAVPAPPPRRQPRIEVKTNALDSQDNEPPPRTSMDSILSRSGSVRQSINAPAPPPPRRTISSSKHPSHPSTPLSSTHIHPPELDPPRASLDSSRPMAPPPPPPARNPSTRRPQSLYGLESSQRRTMSDIKPRDTVAPPPPPSRSQSSTGGRSGRTSLDSARKPRTSADDFSDLNEQYIGQSGDILADLESLQREVDALRGKMG
ncbi:hypothetical protein ACHAPX_006774 [Trichoderma viride]|jgi:hypothetical protein